VNFGWREGIPADEAKIYFEEAKQLAIAANDMRSNALINAAYGRILASGGSADEYVARILDAKAIAEAGSDASVQIALKAVLCHALRLAGRLTEALQMNVEATQRAHEIVEFDRQMLGLDVELWLTVMHGQTLVTLGRLEDARPLLDHILQKPESEVDVIHSMGPSLAYVDIAWANDDPQLALEHAHRAFALATKSGNPYLRVYAQASRGLAQAIAGNLAAAIDDLATALRFARSRKVGLENEARMLADLADAYRLSGDTRGALETADEAIKVATARHARVAECLARIVRSRILRESGTADQQEARDELVRANALMHETGAFIYRATIDGLAREEKLEFRSQAMSG